MEVIGTFRGSPVSLLLKRYARFCLIGGMGMIVDMGIIWLLASPSMLGWNLTVSKIIAAEAAILNNFIWNDAWTFRGLAAAGDGGIQRLARFGKFNLICAAGIGLSVLLLNAQVYGLHLNLYLANFIAIVLVSLWNFFLNLRFGQQFSF